MIRFAQMNMRGALSKLGELEVFLFEHSIDIFLMCETHLSANSQFSVPGFFITRTDRNSHGGGSMIGVKSGIGVSPVACPIPDCSAVDLFIPSAPVIRVVSVYFSPSLPFPSSQLNLFIQSSPHPLLLAGDVNAKNHLWGSSTCDSRGAELLQILDQHSLFVLNTGSPTYFSPNTFTATSSSIHHLFSGWHTSNDLSSDHLPIVFSLSSSLPPPTGRYTWRFTQANWPSFAANLTSSIIPNLCLTDTDIFATHLSTDILQAAKANIPRSFITASSKRWWTAEIQEAIRKKRRLRRRAQLLRTPASKTAYNSAASHLKRLISTAKQNTWTTQCSRLSHKHPLRLWQAFRSLSGGASPSGIPVLSSSPPASTDDSKADVLNRHFAKVNSHPPSSLFSSQLQFHHQIESMSLPFLLPLLTTIRLFWLSFNPFSTLSLIPPPASISFTMQCLVIFLSLFSINCSSS